MTGSEKHSLSKAVTSFGRCPNFDPNFWPAPD